MTVAEAKELVLQGIFRDLANRLFPVVERRSPDPRDPGKFIIDGKVARVIHHWDGWHPQISLSWFRGSYEQPVINRTPFHWYVFAIPRFRRHRQDHYFVCDYLQMRQWVLEFAAPQGNDHRDHSDWMANIHIYKEHSSETQAYFRWGDEPTGFNPLVSRVISLDNILTVAERPELIGTYGVGGESEAHRRLKLYVADNPAVIGLRATAHSTIEYPFQTGDRVDLLFENHSPLRSIAEVEVEGENNIIVGIHQAIKYRSLAEADAGYPLQCKDTRAIVVAYQTEYEKAQTLASKYDVRLVTVDKRTVLNY